MASMVAVHGSPLWSRSKALLGSISNIERSRVNELQNPEPEKPLAPHWRVPSMNTLLYFYGLDI